MQVASIYQHVCGIIPDSLNGGTDMALDAEEKWIYFRFSRSEAAKHLASRKHLGPRNMGADLRGLPV